MNHRYLHQDNIFNTYEGFDRTICDEQTIEWFPMNQSDAYIQQVSNGGSHYELNVD